MVKFKFDSELFESTGGKKDDETDDTGPRNL